MSTPSVEAQIAVLVGKYAPEIQAQLCEARARLRALFPRGHELVFDTYNALVFAISPSGRNADAFVSVAGYPKWVTLFFLNGTRLADPTGLLQGQGAQVRSIRLKSAADIDTPAVLELVALAALPQQALFAVAAPLDTTIRSVSARQRPRQPAAAPRKAGS